MEEVVTTNNNHMVTLLPEYDICQYHIWQLDLDLVKKISQSSSSDLIITKVLEAMNRENINPWLPWTTKEDWQFEDRKLYFKHRLYILEEVQCQLVMDTHESLVGGHGGFFLTLHLLQKDYWWPGMSTFLQKFISRCAACQSAKMNTHPTVPGLTPLTVESSTPFSSISVDLISGLLTSHGFDSVMVMVDHGLTKGVIYCLWTKEIDAAGVATLFFKHVFP